MSLFIGTLIIVVLCCAAMGLGLMLGGRPLEGGCGGLGEGSYALGRTLSVRTVRVTSWCHSASRPIAGRL